MSERVYQLNFRGQRVPAEAAQWSSLSLFDKLRSYFPEDPGPSYRDFVRTLGEGRAFLIYGQPEPELEQILIAGVTKSGRLATPQLLLQKDHRLSKATVIQIQLHAAWMGLFEPWEKIDFDDWNLEEVDLFVDGDGPPLSALKPRSIYSLGHVKELLGRWKVAFVLNPHPNTLEPIFP